MFRGANRLLVAAAVVAGVVLVAPTAALACDNGGPSAANVYKECALPNGGGGSNPTGPEVSAAGHHPSRISNRTLQALDQTGKDKRVLSAMLKGYGLNRHLQAARASDASGTPSALGSAFDLGSGPTTLLIALAGTAALLLGGSGWRVWRSRHRA